MEVILENNKVGEDVNNRLRAPLAASIRDWHRLLGRMLGAARQRGDQAATFDKVTLWL